jgi:hypothetical protein
MEKQYDEQLLNVEPFLYNGIMSWNGWIMGRGYGMEWMEFVDSFYVTNYQHTLP